MQCCFLFYVRRSLCSRRDLQTSWTFGSCSHVHESKLQCCIHRRRFRCCSKLSNDDGWTTFKPTPSSIPSWIQWCCRNGGTTPPRKHGVEDGTPTVPNDGTSQQCRSSHQRSVWQGFQGQVTRRTTANDGRRTSPPGTSPPFFGRLYCLSKRYGNDSTLCALFDASSGTLLVYRSRSLCRSLQGTSGISRIPVPPLSWTRRPWKVFPREFEILEHQLYKPKHSCPHAEMPQVPRSRQGPFGPTQD